MRILDRYLIRESIPPFLLALAVFTFVIALQPILPKAEQLLAKNVDLLTVGWCILLLLPQALGLTIPAAYFAGVLLALGRLSGDHEAVALLACGVNPLRLLRPILLTGLVAFGLTGYVMIQLIPDSNQTYREVTYRLLNQKLQTDIQPRLYYEGFPGHVLYILDRTPNNTWAGVLLANTGRSDKMSFDLADQGNLVLDPKNQEGALALKNAIRYMPGDAPGTYQTWHVESERVTISAKDFFGDPALALGRGFPEMGIKELRELIASSESGGGYPINEHLYLEQKFAFPVACLVLAVLALPSGFHTHREGRLNGVIIGLLVTVVYYGIMSLGEGLARAHHFPPILARWLPNIVMLPVGLIGLWWRARTTGHGLMLRLPSWLRRKPAGAAAPAAASVSVVVLHLPRLWTPRLRLLDLYAAQRHLRLMILSFAGLMSLYYIGTIIDFSSRFFRTQTNGSMLFEYLFYSTPQYIYFVLPVATLVATLSTLAGFSKTNELTALRACGVSVYRLALPLLLFGVLWSAVLFGLSEYILVPANRRASALEDILRGRGGSHTQNLENRNWLAGPSGQIYYYEFFDAPHNRLQGVNILETAMNPYRVVRHTYAHEAVLSSGETWRAQQGWIQHFPTPDQSTREEFTTRDIVLPPRTALITAQIAADEMTYRELSDYIKRLGQSGFSVAEQHVALHRKISFPLVTVVVTLLAVPFGVTVGRRGALYGVAIGVALVVGYFLLTSFFVAAGTAGLLPPVLAAWAANVIFAALAGYLVLTTRT